MEPAVFVTLFAEQIHYSASPAFSRYLDGINLTFKQASSFIGPEAGELTAQDTEFLRMAEVEYRKNQTKKTPVHAKRLRMVHGDKYWRTLMLVSNKSAVLKQLVVAMKREPADQSCAENLNTLLELGYLDEDRDSMLSLTSKGKRALKYMAQKLSKKVSKVTSIAEDSTEREDTSLSIVLDCRGEEDYLELLHPNVKCHASVGKLSRGDCVIMRGRTPVIMFERKTIPDFYSSISDGRVSKQLVGTRDTGTGVCAETPTILLIEDPQLLFLGENTPFHAALVSLDEGTVSTVLQTSSKAHTASVYSSIFKSISSASFTGASEVPATSTSKQVAATDQEPNDWVKFLERLLGDCPVSVVQRIATVYPSYSAFTNAPFPSVQQRLLAAGISRRSVSQLEHLS